MSSEPPPTYNTPVFNQAYWGVQPELGPLDNRYLQFPTGQGAETIPSLVVTGQATIGINTLKTPEDNTIFNKTASTNPAGGSNAFYGFECGEATTTGGTNSGFGHLETLKSLTTGESNSAFGSGSLKSVLGGNFNTAVGYNSAESVNSGSNNTAIGNNILPSLASGSSNTAIGGELPTFETGNGLINGSNNTFIGAGSRTTLSNAANSTAIGANSIITASNQIVLGTVTESVIIPNQIQFSYSSLPTLSTTSFGFIVAAGSSETNSIGTSPITVATLSNLAIGVYLLIGNGFFFNQTVSPSTVTLSIFAGSSSIFNNIFRNNAGIDQTMTPVVYAYRNTIVQNITLRMSVNSGTITSGGKAGALQAIRIA